MLPIYHSEIILAVNNSLHIMGCDCITPDERRVVVFSLGEKQLNSEIFITMCDGGTLKWYIVCPPYGDLHAPKPEYTYANFGVMVTDLLDTLQKMSPR